MSSPNPADLTAPNAPTVIARQMQDGNTVQVRDLSEAIADIRIETAIQGSGILEVHVIDPEWQLLTSGFIQVYDDGLLAPVDVNYPDHTDQWWRLAAVQASTELSQGNLVLRFEDRIASQLRDIWPEPGRPAPHAAPGQTRADFIRSLVQQVPGIKFISPSINELRAADTVYGVKTDIAPVSSAPGAATPSNSPPGANIPNTAHTSKQPAPKGVPHKPGGSVGNPVASGVGAGVSGVVGGVISLLNPPSGAQSEPRT